MVIFRAVKVYDLKCWRQKSIDTESKKEDIINKIVIQTHLALRLGAYFSPEKSMFFL